MQPIALVRILKMIRIYKIRFVIRQTSKVLKTFEVYTKTQK